MSQHHKEHFKNCGHTGDEFHPPVPDPPNTPTEQPGGEVVANKRGTLVNADFGEGEVLAFLLDGGHQNDAGETKFWVQKPGGGKAELTYREPGDRDASGSGVTFWNL